MAAFTFLKLSHIAAAKSCSDAKAICMVTNTRVVRYHIAGWRGRQSEDET
jgi:hypothetical protein